MDLKIVISVNSTTVLHITSSLSGFMLFCFSMKYVYDNCIFHILIRVLFFQIYYTFRVSLNHASCKKLHVLLHATRLHFELRAAYCSTTDWNMLIAASCTAACYAFSVGTTPFTLHYDTCLLQLHVLLLIVWLQLELRASYCSTSAWNMLIARCSWTRACYVSSIWATRVILYWNVLNSSSKEAFQLQLRKDVRATEETRS
jgi:hypothetical protein